MKDRGTYLKGAFYSTAKLILNKSFDFRFSD